MTLPFFGKKPAAPSTQTPGTLRCNEPGPLRRQYCIVGPEARKTDPRCAGCSQLNANYEGIYKVAKERERFSMNSRIEVKVEGRWVVGLIDGKVVISANARSGVVSSRTVPANLDDAEAYEALIQAVVAKVRELREEGGEAK